MRRFIIGLVVGTIVGLAVAWWRLGQAGQVGLMERDQEPVRIALPEVPWSDEEEEIPEAEPVVPEAGESAGQLDESVIAQAREAAAGAERLLAYCARCRAKRPIQNLEPTATRDGRPAVRGTCPECGANMFRFVSV